MSEGKSGSNTSTDLMIIIVVCVAIMMGIIFVFNHYYWLVNAFYGAIAYIYVYPVAKLVDFAPWLLKVPLLGHYLFGPCMAVNDFLGEGGFSQMTFTGPNSARSFIMNAAGRVAFIIYAPLLLKAAFTETQVHVDQFYKRRHSLESMIREQAKTFPIIRLFRDNDPIATPDLLPKDFASGALRQLKNKKPAGDLISGQSVMIRASGFTRSINPEEWMVSNGLVLDVDEYKKLTSGLFPADDRSFYFSYKWPELSIASISEVLEDQLVQPWRGPENMPVHLQAIFTVMVLFYAYKRDEGNALLEDLGRAADIAAVKKVDIAEVIMENEKIMSLIKDTIESTAGKQMTYFGSRHAWLQSALPTLLKRSRFERGVFASASFIWLKKYDRPTWYILNATGNDAVNIEAAGAMAHNRAELDFQGPLVVPHVYQAARSVLHDYLDCHPEKVQKRTRREEERRDMDQIVQLMSNDATLAMHNTMALENADKDRMRINYDQEEDV